jgi:hypothetical protein
MQLKLNLLFKESCIICDYILNSQTNEPFISFFVETFDIAYTIPTVVSADYKDLVVHHFSGKVASSVVHVWDR